MHESHMTMSVHEVQSITIDHNHLPATHSWVTHIRVKHAGGELCISTFHDKEKIDIDVDPFDSELEEMAAQYEAANAAALLQFPTPTPGPQDRE